MPRNCASTAQGTLAAVTRHFGRLIFSWRLSGGDVDHRATMEHTRDHIIFFMAQKMYFLERAGSRESSTAWSSISSRSTSTGSSSTSPATMRWTWRGSWTISTSPRESWCSSPAGRTSGSSTSTATGACAWSASRTADHPGVPPARRCVQSAGSRALPALPACLFVQDGHDLVPKPGCQASEQASRSYCRASGRSSGRP